MSARASVRALLALKEPVNARVWIGDVGLGVPARATFTDRQAVAPGVRVRVQHCSRQKLAQMDTVSQTLQRCVCARVHALIYISTLGACRRVHFQVPVFRD